MHDTHAAMQRSGVAANVVTYNTLIDVYGKVGRWEEALKVLDRMKTEVRLAIPHQFPDIGWSSPPPSTV